MNKNKLKLKTPNIDTIMPDPAWVKDIANFYSKGIPLSRLAELYNVPKQVIEHWINEAAEGNPKFMKLRRALAEAAKQKEVDLLQSVLDLAKGNIPNKTVKTVKDADGKIIRQEETIQTNKPDIEAIKLLLELSSDHYKNIKNSNININNVTPVQVNLVDNGRPVEEQE